MNTPTERTSAWSQMGNSGDVYAIGEGTFMLASAAAVAFANRNPAVFSSAFPMAVGNLAIRLIPMTIDPPDHRRYRRALDPLFRPDAIQSLENDFRREARACVSRLAEAGRCELISELCVPLPTSVLAALLDIPRSRCDELRKWVETVVNKTPHIRPECADEHRAATESLLAFMHQHVDAKRGTSGDDLLSQLIVAEDPVSWSHDELASLCMVLAIGGLDSVTTAMGHLFYRLADSPELRQRIAGAPDQAAELIEEVLRLEPPAPVLARHFTEDVSVCGARIPAGSQVLLCLATANRDADRYPSPHEVVLSRSDKAHYTFGGGPHRCLGMSLARMQLRITLEEFQSQISDYTLESGFTPTVVWPSGTMHLEALHLVYEQKTK